MGRSRVNLIMFTSEFFLERYSLTPPFYNIWGQGVDSVSYPGPSIHPIMSLKIYILLYIYVITMEWIE